MSLIWPCSARSGVILLDREGTEIQKLHFGEKALVQMREKALAKWQDTEAMAGRNQVRAWLDVSIASWQFGLNMSTWKLCRYLLASIWFNSPTRTTGMIA